MDKSNKLDCKYVHLTHDTKTVNIITVSKETVKCYFATIPFFPHPEIEIQSCT